MPANEKTPETLTKTLSLSGIFEPISKPLEALDIFLEKLVEKFSQPTQKLVRYTFAHRGKRLRPALVFFSGMSDSGDVPEELVKAAAIVEIVHLATLVHDDILDDATIRHASPTLFAKYGAHTAVLLGDTILAQALELAAKFNSPEFCRKIAAATKTICDGEIWQTAERGNSALSLDSYFKIIEMKTGVLFEISAFLGATIGGNGLEFAKACAKFGNKIGRAYQIFDDLVDFLGNESSIGKTLGTDFLSGKFTLPTILFLEKKSPRERREIVKKISAGTMKFEELREKMKAAGTFEEGKKFFDEACRSALEAISPFRERNSSGTRGLENIAKFVSKQVEKFFAEN